MKELKSGTKLHAASSNSNSGMKIVDGSLVFGGTSMHHVAACLSTFAAVDRPVLDKAGINGIFDFAVKLADTSLEMKRTMLKGTVGPWKLPSSITSKNQVKTK